MLLLPRASVERAYRKLHPIAVRSMQDVLTTGTRILSITKIKPTSIEYFNKLFHISELKVR